ncbi:zinc finger, matrin type 2 (macronuclear) [Tetrahymena thermophila SB210]|uniref:Zinc finger, matrin type 2 n=1 Tax=Tetrahymena thermophila (strain SB210) TaxID=312017 RepID=I7MDE5_TETTS|nr:zinc finger, matrin type 2 [Tetrahymena thermophila SB210]EAR87431.1 zinc finger, matrin type 2 [Tetrahymena thermophila SB210]|eukprot:XP_001007676.1 zinc finger, matrin type 2 [Tetrahymena thermophila SB210]
MSMKDDLTKEEIPENDANYEKVVEEVFDEKYGRKKFIVKKVLKQKQKDEDIDGTNTIQQTIYFQRRTEDLGLDKKIGERINVLKESHKSEHGGFYCQLCDTHVWDSNAWLDHVNGKKHNRLLGMNNKVEKVGLDQIKAKLESLKKDKQQKVKDYEQLIYEMDNEQQDKKIKFQNDRKKLKTEEQSAYNPSDSQNKHEQKSKSEELQKQEFTEDSNKKEGDDKEQNKEQKKGDEDSNQNEEEEEEEEEDPNAAMMAMMGLPTSFNTKAKN